MKNIDAKNIRKEEIITGEKVMITENGNNIALVIPFQEYEKVKKLLSSIEKKLEIFT